MIKEGQIVYANLTFKNKKGEKIFVREKVIGREYDKPLQLHFSALQSKRKFSIEQELTLSKIDIIRDMGMKNPPSATTTYSFTESKE